MKVSISRDAMVSMVMSAVEVYKKETFGVLIGKKSGKEIKINHAINFQSATRDYEYVSIDKIRENRINRTLKYITNFKVVGDFHSHADFPEKLSNHDKEELRKSGKNSVSILILIKRTKTKGKWRYDSTNKRVIGPLANTYMISITANMFNYKKDKAERVPIKCNYIRDLNKRITLYSKLDKELEKIKKLEERHKKLKKYLNAKKMRI